jgi:hypothetical protein
MRTLSPRMSVEERAGLEYSAEVLREALQGVRD